MSDDDKSAKGFLERWARKKSEAQDAGPREREKVEQPAVVPDTATPQVVDAPAAPEFDISTLPSLDSITAATDIRVFLHPGVPQELARAALRRAWAADPAIRDFRGLQENDWDFNDPDSIPGFGKFKPGEDISKLVARVFGEEDKPAEAEDGEPAANVEARAALGPPESDTPDSDESSQQLTPASEDAATPPSTPIVQRNVNIASQQEPAAGPTHRRRQHGSALPE